MAEEKTKKSHSCTVPMKLRHSTPSFPIESYIENSTKAAKLPLRCKKIMVVGPSDSGKTTWIAPILEIMDYQHVASITRETSSDNNCFNSTAIH